MSRLRRLFLLLTKIVYISETNIYILNFIPSKLCRIVQVFYSHSLKRKSKLHMFSAKIPTKFFKNSDYLCSLCIDFLSEIWYNIYVSHRGIVQSVEHQSPKLGVVGSSPSAPAKKRHLRMTLFKFI